MNRFRISIHKSYVHYHWIMNPLISERSYIRSPKNGLRKWTVLEIGRFTRVDGLWLSTAWILSEWFPGSQMNAFPMPTVGPAILNNLRPYTFLSSDSPRSIKVFINIIFRYKASPSGFSVIDSGLISNRLIKQMWIKRIKMNQILKIWILKPWVKASKNVDVNEIKIDERSVWLWQ